jgi:hypothetical protein
VLLLGEDYDIIEPVLTYLFDKIEVNVQDSWRLR